LLIGRFLLPTHPAAADPISHFRLEDYLTEVAVLPDSSLLKKTIAEVEESDEFISRLSACCEAAGECLRRSRRCRYARETC
jgi:hypothetical protein